MTMTPYYEADGCTIFHGDCRDVVPFLADVSLACVVTSPPFNQMASMPADSSGHGLMTLTRTT